MVLQLPSTSPGGPTNPTIFGYTDVAQTVYANVTSSDGTWQRSYQQQATGPDQRWTMALDAPTVGSGSENYTLTVWGSSEPSKITTVRNVAFGDVLFCGGQSNMVMSVGATFNGTQIAAMTYPNIRLFTVITQGATTVQKELPAFVNTTVSRCYWGDYVPRLNVSNKMEYACQSWVPAQSGYTEYISAVCFYTALHMISTGMIPEGRPVGLVQSAYSGTPMEQWVPQPIIDSCATPTRHGMNGEEQISSTLAQASTQTVADLPPGNSTLWNAMIAPIAGYNVRAILWNQGESNMGQPFPYFSCLFQSLIAYWRQTWGQAAHGESIPWIFVQLGNQLDDSMWKFWPAYIGAPRAAQASALPGLGRTAHTGMAVAYDQGDITSPYAPAHVHSRYKWEIGRRTALALQVVEGGTGDLSGPVPTTLVDNKNGSYTLTWQTGSGQGVTLAGTEGCWECCAANDTFIITTDTLSTHYNISTQYLSPTTLLLTPVKKPYTENITITYAPSLWAQCGVYSISNGVPASTFVMNMSGVIVPT